ncbi:MAG: 16S rRNA (uracil(1498)-N(3))-methyltransferase [Butyrivibrio sp.]|nr:16S rRNA (uracil(1498)-N(3))-methyltransferase [Butyrivibrio sp.]MCR4833059.1 16S rRNA (uracil(1498)-N(3))-methyltransferase [Butyrivibrio sp.]
MFHFFAESSQMSLEDKTLTITGSDYNHIANVLRMKVGEELSVSLRDSEDGKEYRYGIEEITEDTVVCRLRFIKEDGLELPSKVYLFQGLPKADKMELIIQKCVELGVYQVIPVSTKRSIVKLDEKKAESKIKRWQSISEAAAKQSKRRIIPEVSKPVTMKQAVEMAKEMDVRLIPYELAEGMDKTREIINSIEPGQSVAIFIGPEGGFDDKEIELCRENGIEPITLGKRILRTETAGFTVLAWLGFHLDI